MYGLRGVRVGEASHPGPPRLRISGGDEGQHEVLSTVPASDGALGALDRGRVTTMGSDRQCGKFGSTIAVVFGRCAGEGSGGDFQGRRRF